MNAKAPNMASTGSAPSPWSFLAELGRQQLAMAAESTSAIYRAREAVRAVQHQAAHEASARHAETARKLCAPCEPADMLSIQAELIRSNIQGAGQYWQQLGAAAMQTQVEMMASMSRLLDGEAGAGVESVLQAFPPLAHSFFAIRRDGANEQQDA